MSYSFRPHGLYPARLLCPQNSLGQNSGVDCHALLQGIFPTQKLNPGLQHCRQILYHLSYQGSHLQICSLSLSLSLSSSIWGLNNVNINMLDVALSISSTILSFKILFSVQLE